MDSINDRIEHVSSSIHFTGHALKELYTLLDLIDSEIVVNTIHKPPFNFYRVSLTYLIVTEYYKLFECNEDSFPKKSSIAVLLKALKQNNHLHKDELVIFKSTLKEISKEVVHKRLMKLRVKKISHSDEDEVNKPWNMPIITKEEIIACYNILMKLNDFINIINKMNDKTYLLLDDFYKKTLSHNAIIQFAVSKQYYLDHFVDAQKKGYDIFMGTLPKINN